MGLKNKHINQKSILLVLIIVIILLGFFLRVHDLDKESLWFDEGFTVKSINQNSVKDVVDSVDKWEQKPVTFFILIHSWTKLFGLSVFSLRFLPMIFGSISIILIFFLSNELFGKSTAILSSLLLSVSLLDVLYSQEARIFSLFTTVTLLSFFVFSKLIKNESSNKINYNFYLFLFLVNALVNSIHYFGWLIFTAQNIIFMYLFWADKIKIKRWLFYQFLIILAFIPFLPKLINKIFWWNNYLINIFVFKWGLPSYLSNLGIFLFLLPPLIFIISLVWITKNWSKIVRIYNSLNKGVLVLLILVYYAIILIFIDVFSVPFFLTRYSLFALPFLYIFFAKVINDLSNKKLRFISLSLILILAFGSLSIYYMDTTKEEWDKSASFILKNEKPGEVIIFEIGDSREPFDFYYKGHLDYTENIPKSDFWLILSHTRREISDYAEDLSGHNLDLEKNYKGIKIYHFKGVEQ